MKYITLTLFFCFACLGQEKAHLTAYRLVGEVTDGPCSVKEYVKYNAVEKYVWRDTFVTAESDDQQLIHNLLDIKKKAPRGKSRDFYCKERSMGGESIHNMFVFSGSVTDTIFTDSSNKWIIFPDRQKAYLDKDLKFTKALTGIIKEFMEYDFKTPILAHFHTEGRDSIPTGSVLHRGRSGVAFLNNIVKNAEGYSLFKTDTIYSRIKKIYVQGNDSIEFYEDKITVDISDTNTGWDIDGIKPGEPESKLFEKYPASTQLKMIYLMRFEDIKRKYFYTVLLSNGKGYISYFIKDKKIECITIDLN